MCSWLSWHSFEARLIQRAWRCISSMTATESCWILRESPRGRICRCQDRSISIMQSSCGGCARRRARISIPRISKCLRCTIAIQSVFLGVARRSKIQKYPHSRVACWQQSSSGSNSAASCPEELIPFWTATECRTPGIRLLVLDRQRASEYSLQEFAGFLGVLAFVGR